MSGIRNDEDFGREVRRILEDYPDASDLWVMQYIRIAFTEYNHTKDDLFAALEEIKQEEL